MMGWFGRVSRAEALAAVALVVGARQEPVAALRRLAGGDTAPSILNRVANYLAAGRPLVEALITCRLLRPCDAARLTTTEPELLAEELSRLAQRQVTPPFGEILVNWFPVWVVLVAAGPSLILAALVAAMSGTLYEGIWKTLMMQSMLRGGELQPSLPGSWWFAQCGAVILAAALAGGLWWILRQSLAHRGLSLIAGGLDRAALFADLLHRLRTGGEHQALLKKWLWRSGDYWGVHTALAEAGDQTTTAFMTLGLIPRNADGRPEWDTALAEADKRRQRAADEVTPWLAALLVIAGVQGFFSWGQGGDVLFVNISAAYFGFTLPQEAAPWLVIMGAILRDLVFIAVNVVIMANLLFVFGWLHRWLDGSVRDWPLVADRLARALERRENMDEVLRGLCLAVHRPMRRCLERALASDQPQPGKRLAEAGVIPAAQATAITAASGADLPDLLRTAAADPEDHGIRSTMGQASPLLVMILVVAGLVSYLSTGVFPKFTTMFRSLHQSFALTLVPTLLWWAMTIIQVTLVCVVLGGLVFVVGRGRGWWVAWGGWARLARGLVLRRQLAAGCREEVLAHTLRNIFPRLPPTLEHSASRGDLPGLLAVAGWRVRDAAGLDRAINAHLIAQDRRRARWALCARLTLPLLIAVPVGLTAASTMLAISGLQRHMIDMTYETRAGSGGGGGTPGMALIFWWTARCEAQGQAVVDALRESQLPVKRIIQPRSSPSAPVSR